MSWIGQLGGATLGALGNIQQQGYQNQAEGQLSQAAQDILNITVPDPAEQALILQNYQNTGQMDPRLQQAVKQSGTQMSDINTNPAEKTAQLNALSSLQDIADRGGRSLQQDSYLNDLNSQVASQNQGRIGAIQSSFAQRGMGQPGGLELAAQLQNSQNMTGIQNQGAMSATAQAQQNALQAIQQAGSQAGQLRSQDFGQQAQVAQAQDQINQFNTAALNSANAANVQAQNQAQAYNVQNAQNISNANTQTNNYQQQYNKQLQQQQFNNQMQKQSAYAGAILPAAQENNTRGQTVANLYGGMGQAMNGAGGAAGANSSGGSGGGSQQPAGPGMWNQFASWAGSAGD